MSLLESIHEGTDTKRRWTIAIFPIVIFKMPYKINILTEHDITTRAIAYTRSTHTGANFTFAGRLSFRKKVGCGSRASVLESAAWLGTD